RRIKGRVMLYHVAARHKRGARRVVGIFSPRDACTARIEYIHPRWQIEMPTIGILLSRLVVRMRFAQELRSPVIVLAHFGNFIVLTIGILDRGHLPQLVRLFYPLSLGPASGVTLIGLGRLLNQRWPGVDRTLKWQTIFPFVVAGKAIERQSSVNNSIGRRSVELFGVAIRRPRVVSDSGRRIHISPPLCHCRVPEPLVNQDKPLSPPPHFYRLP